MINKLILRLSNEMGNQLFMYAAGYSISKKLNRELFIDNETAFTSRKNISEYGLDNFNFTSSIAPRNLKFLNLSGYLKRKISKKIDFFNTKKKFLVEKKNYKKITHFTKDFFIKKEYSPNLFLEGHFESEKYFHEHKKEILNEFSFKDKKSLSDNYYYNLINNSNSVAICIRQNRFSERKSGTTSEDKRESDNFTIEQINYVNKCINVIKSKINNPKFFLWSNNYDGLHNHFPSNAFTMILNENNLKNSKKSVLDLFLMTQAKHYIVIPSSYNWWGCYLSSNKKKIVLRPDKKNFSKFEINNLDLWPESWIKI